MNQHEQDTTDVLRGPKANARRNWDGNWILRNWDGNWILENAKTRKPFLISTKEQILEEYDRRNKTII